MTHAVILLYNITTAVHKLLWKWASWRNIQKIGVWRLWRQCIVKILFCDQISPNSTLHILGSSTMHQVWSVPEEQFLKYLDKFPQFPGLIHKIKGPIFKTGFLISEGMESELGRLLLFHQSTAADRRGNHSLHGAGTTSHRICTPTGNDCLICPEEHNRACTDKLNTPVFQCTSSQLKCRFPEEYEFIEYKIGGFVAHT